MFIALRGLGSRPLFLYDEAEQKAFGAHEVVLESARFFLCEYEYLSPGVAESSDNIDDAIDSTEIASAS